jgi:hypothetical protein
MELSGIGEAIALAESRWPGVEFRAWRNGASSPCPWCGGEDRFMLSDRGHYRCRPGDGHCGREGWLDEEEQQTLSPEEKRHRMAEARLLALEREARETKKRLTKLEQMAQCTDYLQYHDLLDKSDRQWWHSQGIMDEQIEEYKLGVCFSCPTDMEHRPSHTIPIWDSHWSQLLNIRHRIIGAENGNKYRPHMAGLGVQLFNSRHVLKHKEVGLVEGEKKSIILSAHGFPCCGIPGINTFDERWLKHFGGVKRLWLAPDPGAEQQMEELGQRIVKLTQIEVSLLTLWEKPDDLILEMGDTAFRYIKQYARRVH